MFSFNTLQELQKFQTVFKISEIPVHQKFWLLDQIEQMSELDQFLSELYKFYFTRQNCEISLLSCEWLCQ